MEPWGSRTNGAILLVLAGALAAACGSGGPETPAPVGAAVEAISGGTAESAHPGVVGIRIQYDGYNGLCTGSLIAQNLVLTARHCIAPTKPGAVTCGEPAFQAPYPASATRVTTSADALSTTAAFVDVSDVWVLDGNDACGVDMALLLLAGKGIDPSVAKALVPRIDKAVTPSEKYVAVGYGSTQANGTMGAGARRKLGGLVVSCVGAACKDTDVAATEWRGDRGTCVGDSGGPALDADDNVIGVLSRSSPACIDPEYGSVVAWKDWLVAQALTASQRGGLAPPAWTTPTSADAGADDAAAGDPSAPEAGDQAAAAPTTTTTTSCSLTARSTRGTGTSPGLPVVGLAALVALAGARRHRKPRS